jgi:hypothetical protein
MTLTNKFPNRFLSSRERLKMSVCAYCRFGGYMETAGQILALFCRKDGLLPIFVYYSFEGPNDVFCHYCGRKTQLVMQKLIPEL